MIDRTFTAALAFAMLAFGAATFASLATETAAPRHVQLERVVITAKRIAPQVVALDTRASQAAIAQ
jgi:hypothetical protein